MKAGEGRLVSATMANGGMESIGAPCWRLLNRGPAVEGDARVDS
jgi:hypothetical protein